MNNEKDQLFDQTESQRNPYLARPEDFTVTKPHEAANQSVPGHGQHGTSAREYEQLLKQSAQQPGKSRFTGKGAPLATSADETIHKQQAPSK